MMRIVGRAMVEVAPDFVTVRVGVSTKAPTPTGVLDQNSAVARKIIDFSKAFGIEARDIQTDAVHLAAVMRSVHNPDGDYRQELDGYTAENAVEVKLSDLSRLGAFMGQVVEQGATEISRVEFGVSDDGKARDEARRKAVEDAMRQAPLLAQAAKVKLGRIVDVTHPLRSEIDRSGDGHMMARRLASRTVPIEAGRSARRSRSSGRSSDGAGLIQVVRVALAVFTHEFLGIC